MSNASLEKGGGDVTGPASDSSTDEAIVRWDGTTGKLIQDSVATLTDAGVCDGITQLNVDSLRMDGITLSSVSGSNILIQPDGSGVLNANTSIFKVEESQDNLETIMRVNNPSTTGGASRIRSTVGGATSGDTFINVEINTVRSYCWGIDNSDSDILKMNTNAGTTVTPSSGVNVWNMTTDGENTMPLQPAFAAFQETTDSDVLGSPAGTYLLGNTSIGTTLTEEFDQGGDFTPGAAGGAFFTAPVDGKYHFEHFCLLQSMNGTTHSPSLNLNTTNRNYLFGDYSATFTGNFPMTFSLLTEIDMGDIARFGITVSGGTQTIDLFGDAGTPRTGVTGFLAC